MRIDKIEICNLASLEGEQVIDFMQEPLKSAGLFAITGKTGAGKSTVLDAICLALYNEAPRLGNKEIVAKATDDTTPNIYNTCNMLRRGATQGYSRITFSLDDGTQYMAKWVVGLTRNNTYKPIQRELVQLKPKHVTLADKNTDVQRLIQQIVRLDYSQFTRTVILAQNSFANFLSAKRGEKSQLLEKITGTEIYAKISSKIFEETKYAEQELTGARQYMDGLANGSLSAEDLQQTEESLRLRTSQLSKSKEDLQKVERQIEWLEQYEQALANLEQKKVALQDARQAYNQLYDRQHELERYDLLQPFAKIYTNIKQAEETIARMKSETSAKEAEQEKYNHDVELSKDRYREANDRLLSARQAMTNRQGDINRGRMIQGKLSAVQATLKTTQDDIHRNEDELQQRNDTRNSKEAELNDSKKRLGEAQLAMQTMRQHQAMVAQMEFVRAHLQKMNEMRHEIEDTQHKLDGLGTDLKQCKDRFVAEEDNSHKQQEMLNRLQAELLLHEQANKGLTSQEIQGRLTKLTDVAMRSGNAIRLWTHIDNGFTNISNKTDELRRRKATHAQQADEIKEAQIQVEKFSYGYDLIHQNYTLSQSEDVANMRKSLKEGTPCPLCGSTHHPYHPDSAQQLDDFMSNLLEQHQRAFEDMQSAKQRLTELQQIYDTEHGQLQVEEGNLAKMKMEQAEDIKAWAQYADLDNSFAQCDENVNRDNRRVILNQIYESSSKERDITKTRLEEFTKHQDEINRVNAEIKDVQQKITETSRRQTEIKAHMQILDNHITTCQKSIEETRNKLGRESSLVEPLMTITGWKERWANSYEAFDRELAAIKAKWDDANETLTQEESTRFRLQQELTTLQKASEDLQHARRDLVGKADVMQQDITRLEAELQTLFGDSTVDKEADRLEMAVKTAEEDSQKAMARYNEVRQSLDKISGELTSLRQQCDAQEKEHRDLRTKLDIEISRFNTGQDYTLQYFELDKYFSDPQSWQQLRKTIDDHKKRVAAEQFKVESASQEVAKLEASPSRPAEEEEHSVSGMRTAQEMLSKKVEEIEKERNSLEFIVKTHKESIQNMEFYRSTLEKAEANWQAWKQLCDVLGSADGNAFREIAQCYTFDFLVDFANLQLADLTSRYYLRKRRNTLQLEVVDRYMLDQVRAVNSLSGGETFIVSLALALGLSALSGNNLEIGSLFIDEGFGNLDNENLNMVIDALSNLPRTQHRKVGVISHTELIQARISPKICLIPETGGRSRIEIKG